MGHNQQTQHQTLHPLQIQRNLQSDDCDVSVPPSFMSQTPVHPPPPPLLLVSPTPAQPPPLLLTSPSSHQPPIMSSPSQPPPLMPSPSQPSPMLSSPSQSSSLLIPSPSTSSQSTPSQEVCPPTPDFQSQVVKNEIKMKVAKNLRRISEESLPYPSPGSVSIKKERDQDDFTGDDEEKRRRRRLRNKIAAEKCRNKRKKAIEKLYSESESVAVQNARFKEDIQRLEAEHRQLLMVLEQHKPVCRRNCGTNVPDGIKTNIDKVKTEKEDVEVYRDNKEEQFSNVYKYPGDIFDTINYNFTYTGGYYDTACLAI